METTYPVRAISPVIRNEAYRYLTAPLAAAQDFRKGAPALLNAGGTTQEGGVNPALILGFFAADAEQYAWQDDTLGHVSPSVPVALAVGQFRGTLKGTFAVNDVGTTYGITEGADGIWYVDRAKTTNQRVRILSVEDGVVAGDIDVPVTFEVLPANRQVVI